MAVDRSTMERWRYRIPRARPDRARHEGRHREAEPREHGRPHRRLREPEARRARRRRRMLYAGQPRAARRRREDSRRLRSCVTRRRLCVGTSVALADLRAGDIIQFRDYTYARVTVTEDDTGTTTDEEGRKKITRDSDVVLNENLDIDRLDGTVRQAFLGHPERLLLKPHVRLYKWTY